MKNKGSYVPFIDMHCDTMSQIFQGEYRGKPGDLKTREGHITMDKLVQGGCMCQNFALFTMLASWRPNVPARFRNPAILEKYPTPGAYAVGLSDTFDREIAANSELIRPALSAADIEANFENGYISALKTIEEGAVYGGSTEVLKDFYDRGVRMTTLTWNFENELAYPNSIDMATGKSVPDTEHGLKKAGKEVVEACRELGIIVDVSHLNDAGIYDILDIYGTATPIAASHSNARGLTDHARNLTDDMLKKIADGGGITGINYCADFINSRGDNNTLIEDMVAHIIYIENVAGIETIGLGSDFDGIGSTLEIGDCSGIQALAEALDRAGFSEDKIEKIFYKNALRVYKEVMG